MDGRHRYTKFSATKLCTYKSFAPGRVSAQPLNSHVTCMSHENARIQAVGSSSSSAPDPSFLLSAHPRRLQVMALVVECHPIHSVEIWVGFSAPGHLKHEPAGRRSLHGFFLSASQTIFFSIVYIIYFIFTQILPV